MISSSGQLTQLVKKYALEFITCEMQLGKAELTLFKAFPNVGVDIVDVALVNPMEGSPSDTLANIDNLIVVVDTKNVTVDGRMTLDKNGEYHLSVTESPMPTRFGLNISGPLNKLDYKFEKSKFPTPDFDTF